MLPKFSLRAILLLTTGAAALSAVIARGVQGDAWAIAITAAFAWAAFAMLVHAAFYLTAIGLSGLQTQSEENVETIAPTAKSPVQGDAGE